MPGRSADFDCSRARPTSQAVSAGGGCLNFFFLVYLFSFLSHSPRETARYRLKYCLKGPLSPTQQTIQITWLSLVMSLMASYLCCPFSHQLSCVICGIELESVPENFSTYPIISCLNGNVSTYPIILCLN